MSWNYREEPDFASGGLQLYNYQGESLLRYQSPRYQPLSTTAETITWTQVLVTSSHYMGFQITNGQSTTWGTFGAMSLSRTPGLNNLNGYSPVASVRNTCVTYGSNRVDLLMLASVRYVYSDGTVVIDSTPRVVVERDEDGEEVSNSEGDTEEDTGDTTPETE